tara:strand:- start:1865 stop:3325 length:1461 start_codon:yes stop_codon:yes gene_type:complete
MATIGTSRGTNIPNIDNTLDTTAGKPAGNKVVNATKLGRGFKLTPDSYTTIDELIKATKEDIMPDLVKTYGDQGLTGFLKLTGAVNNGGSSDQIEWWEEGRRHRSLAYTDNLASSGATLTVTTAAVKANVQQNDVLMDAATGTRVIVTSGGSTSSLSGANVTIKRLDGANFGSSDLGNGGTFVQLGNLYAQGTNQPTGFIDPGMARYANPYMIVKDRYEVNGSQATNIGYVNMGNGDFRWFMYGEAEARKRFEDRRELMMLFGEKVGTAYSIDGNNFAGSEGYFSAIEDRGINVSGASANPLDSFSEFDDIIIELDKQGAPSEYAMYVNRKQDLAIDDMLAAGIATGVTAGLPGQFGAFQNSPDMAVQLGFKSFTRGGYTFHKHDWRLLNDPTMLGAVDANFVQGVMVPLATVADARSGASVPALSMHYKEANGYSREMEHWVTGGGVLGHNNNGDAGTDQAVFHYRSEIALCVRAANQHVLIKGA